LSALLSKLDPTASDVVAHQRDSLVQRKDLAQKTKDFKKLHDAGKLAEQKGLLKGTSASSDRLFPQLTTLSVPKLHRSSHKPGQDLVLGLSTIIFVTVRGSRPLPTTRSISRIPCHFRRHFTETHRGEEATAEESG
jgi:hypothetical protein